MVIIYVIKLNWIIWKKEIVILFIYEFLVLVWVVVSDKDFNVFRKDNFFMGINLKDFIIKLNIGEDSFSLK